MAHAENVSMTTLNIDGELNEPLAISTLVAGYLANISAHNAWFILWFVFDNVRASEKQRSPNNNLSCVVCIK